MYMPVPAISQAMSAPSGPVAFANVLGREKIPAPTIDPTTMAVSCIRDIFCSVEAMPFLPVTLDGLLESLPFRVQHDGSQSYAVEDLATSYGDSQAFPLVSSPRTRVH